MTSETIDRKTAGITEDTSATPQVTVVGKKIPYLVENVLDQYRSYTYNWTLAALSKEKLKNPKSWIDKPLDLVILKSGGKNAEGISTKDVNNNVPQFTRFAPTSEALPDETGAVGSIRRNLETGELYDSGDLYKNKLASGSQNAPPDAATVRRIIEDFNQSGFGRFDMYIDDVEIETLATFTKETNTTLASGLKFDVFEPYSINGFIQALHVAALAAGYQSHKGASYVLRLEFIGYKDNELLPEPEKIQFASRNFVIRFNGMEVELTDKGTRYRCSATPFHEGGFGEPNILKSPIKMSFGKTVKEVLTEFMKNLNQQMSEIAKSSKPASEANLYDEYEIKFADADWNYEKNENEMSKSDVKQLLKEKSMYDFADYGDEKAVDDRGKKRPSGNGTDPGSVMWEPNRGTIQFHSSARIHECIAAVIRDSEYVRNILRTLGEDSNLIDSNGMVNYFIVDIASEVKGYDSVNNREILKYTYIVAPYKVHYTRIPRFGSQKIDDTKFNKITLRNYNYFYTGRNTDVINFKINFNNLFFEAVPRALGNSSYIFSSDALGKNGQSTVIGKPNNQTNNVSDPNGTPGIRDSTSNDFFPNTGVAGPADLSPYAIMARNMHNAIIDSKVSQVTGDLEIFGDPIYLTTSGHGNNRPERDSNNKSFTKTGEAAYLSGEMLIRLNFRNPIDINENGFYSFDKTQVPFSGVFRVATVKHFFRNGEFRQTLSLMRIPGQILDLDMDETEPKDVSEVRPNKLDQPVQDQTKAKGREQRLSSRTLSLIDQLNRATAAATQFGSGLVQSLTSPLTEGLNKFGQSLSQASAGVTQITSSLASAGSQLTSAAQKLTQPLAEASQKLGVPLQNLQGASPLVLASMLKLAEKIPAGVDVKASEELGVNLKFSSAKLVNLPPAQPKSTAPAAEQNQTDLENLLKLGGAAALASAFGVNSVSKIPGASLPSGQTAGLVRQFARPSLTSPLAGSVKSLADTALLANKTLSQLNQVSASKEVNLKVAGTTLVTSAATTQLGSKTESPLLRIKDGTQI